VHSFAPHVLSKIDRVSYGLLTAEDMKLSKSRYNFSIAGLMRFLMPF
jgi:hypothetical protein